MVIGLPWALSLLTPRLGWADSGPGAWNLVGLVPVAGGILGLVWVFGTMFAQFPNLPEVVELDEGERLLTATSRILITHGPFAFSRNPMFLSGLIVWLGWALFYGSVLILVVTAVLWALANAFKVPGEERGLEARFGEAYRDYRRRVPRWIGPIRRA
jgi:protein-S-isoprenylcysteine O-methyltransferase Ste14